MNQDQKRLYDIFKDISDRINDEEFDFDIHDTAYILGDITAFMTGEYTKTEKLYLVAVAVIGELLADQKEYDETEQEIELMIDEMMFDDEDEDDEDDEDDKKERTASICLETPNEQTSTLFKLVCDLSKRMADLERIHQEKKDVKPSCVIGAPLDSDNDNPEEPCEIKCMCPGCDLG